VRQEEYESYRGIWCAVLLQTLSDLRLKVFPTGVPNIRDTGNPKKNAAQIRKAYKKREEVRLDYIANRAYARRWMASKSTKPASFLWICTCLDLNADRIRSFAKDPEKINLLLTGKLKL
jgi:hypothetical protein